MHSAWHAVVLNSFEGKKKILRGEEREKCRDRATPAGHSEYQGLKTPLQRNGVVNF